MSRLRIGVLHGPNLNLLGQRETDVYGVQKLDEIDDSLKRRAEVLEVDVEPFQSNVEGELVGRVQNGAVDAWIVNAAAYTHTSVALRDALVAVDQPFVEVHLSNIFSREAFRRTSLLSDVAVGVVTGFGLQSYLLGLEAIVGHLRSDS